MGNNIKDIQQIKSLIAKGKEMGFLTFEEVNKAVPLEMNTPEQFEEIIGIFDQLEIAIVDLEKDGKKSGALSALQALVVSTATRVGMGNLVGVVAAISAGGAGAVFWMWISALLGSSTAFIEATLSQLYKQKDPLYGGYRGGPAYYIHQYAEQKLGGKPRRYSVIAVLFAISGLICWCGISQVISNSVSSSFQNAFNIPPLYSTVLLVALAAVIVLRKNASVKVLDVLVPIMAGCYFLITIFLLIKNAALLPSVFQRIFEEAFGIRQVVAGGFGAVLMQGVKRGLFSNEAGSGSAPCAAAAAHVSHPAKAGLMQALGVFIDTLLICTATAFMLLCSGVEPDAALEGAPYVQAALSAVFGPIGPMFITVAMVLFAFTTLIGNLYYVDNCLNYIVKKVPAKEFMVLFRIDAMLLIFIGAGMQIGTVWNLADVLMGVMALINLPVIILLSRPALLALKDYTAQKNTGRNPVFKAETVGLKGKTEYWN